MTKRFLTLSILVFAIAFGAAVPARTSEKSLSPNGLWLASKKQDVAIQIEECGENLCGQIAWIDGNMEAKRPDVCHMSVLSDFTRARDNADKWVGGKIYRAVQDKYYNAIINQTSDTNVELRAYIGTPALGQTISFKRVSAADYPPCTDVLAAATLNQR